MKITKQLNKMKSQHPLRIRSKELNKINKKNLKIIK